MLTNELIWLAGAAILIGLGLVAIALSLRGGADAESEHDEATADPAVRQEEPGRAFIDQPLAIDLHAALGFPSPRDEPPADQGAEAAKSPEVTEPTPEAPQTHETTDPTTEVAPVEEAVEEQALTPEAAASEDRSRSREEALLEWEQQRRAARRSQVRTTPPNRPARPEERDGARRPKRRAGSFPLRRSK